MAETPSRRWLLRRRSILLGTVLIALAFAGYQLWWWATSEPRTVIDYFEKLEQLAASHQPPGENAWPLFVEAAEQHDAVIGQIREQGTSQQTQQAGQAGAMDFRFVLEGQLQRDQLTPELEALKIMRERGVFEKLGSAAQQPRAVFDLEGEPPLFGNFLLPELALFRDLARSRVASMRLAADEGDQSERLQAFEQTLALARATSSQPILISRLVGIAIAELALREIQYELLEYGIDGPTGHALLDALDRQGRWPTFSMVLDGERLGVLDMIQYSFTDDGHGDGRLDLKRLEEQASRGGGTDPAGDPALQQLGSYLLPGRKRNEKLANEIFDELIAESTLDASTRASRKRQLPQIEARVTMRYPLLLLLVPAISNAITYDERFHRQFAATQLLLAIETFRGATGRLPDKLDELAPEVLERVPRDITHGGPFVYRRAEKDPHGLGYLLYSSGINGIDESAASVAASGQVSGDDVLFLEKRRRDAGEEDPY